MTKGDPNYLKVPKNYKETEVLDFQNFGKTKITHKTLMFILRPDPGETFTPKTIWIPAYSVMSEWLKEETRKTPDEFVKQVAALLSHEYLHIALFLTAGRGACDGLDRLGFGLYCDCVKDEVDGLLNFEHIFKPRTKKLKGWK